MSWLIAGKVRPPERTPFHLDRKTLLKEAEQGRWSVLALRAPGGFGKTTLLAELCRRAKRRNEIAGWLTLDEDDTAESIVHYLGFALEEAGLSSAGSPTESATRLSRIVGAIRDDGRPCLMVLDELENLRGPAVKALNDLLRRVPPNLRLLLGMRRDPGIDLSEIVLRGRGVEYGPDWLRFSKAEISTYFDDAFSHRELIELAEGTEGWAVALNLLRYERSTQPRAAPLSPVASLDHDNPGLAADWFAHRLFRFASREDFELLIDLAQFDWIEPSVVEEVFNEGDSARKLGALNLLDGLAQPVDRKHGEWRLHPMIKAYGEERLKRVDSSRYRTLHGAIGTAMAKRERVASAVRHAVKANDIALLAEILLGAGGLGMLLQEGMARFGSSLEMLTNPVTDRYPRLAMLKCRVLVHQSNLDGALVLFERTRLQTADFTQDPSGGNERILRIEASYIRGILVGFGALPFTRDGVDELVTTHAMLKDTVQVPPALAAGHAVLAFGAFQAMGMFEHAREYIDEAEAIFERIESPHGQFHIHLNFGMVALARGHTAEAQRRYAAATAVVEQRLLGDRGLGQLVNVLLAELHLDCNRLESLRKLAPLVPVPFRNGAAWFDTIAAAHDVIVEWKFENGGVEAALNVLDALQESTRSNYLAAATRHLTALRIDHLAKDGRVDDANWHWADAQLPEQDHDLLQAQGMAWREKEALVCARLRLLMASGQTRPARRLSRQFLGLTVQAGLVRSRMRCLALSAVLEYEAGDLPAATTHLLDYLRLMAATGFARPMVREAAAGRILSDVLDNVSVEPAASGAAESLLGYLAEKAEPPAPEFSGREREILELLGQGKRDKEIARELSLSAHGVRYHLKNIYRKTGAAGRSEAVNWGLARGVIR